MYISDFKDFKYNYKINLAQKNISMDLNIKQINSDPNTLYIKQFANQLITDIIESYYHIIESSFENNDFWRESTIINVKTYKSTKRALIQTRRGETDYGEQYSHGFAKSTFLTRGPFPSRV